MLDTRLGMIAIATLVAVAVIAGPVAALIAAASAVIVILFASLEPLVLGVPALLPGPVVAYLHAGTRQAVAVGAYVLVVAALLIISEVGRVRRTRASDRD